MKELKLEVYGFLLKFKKVEIQGTRKTVRLYLCQKKMINFKMGKDLYKIINENKILLQ